MPGKLKGSIEHFVATAASATGSSQSTFKALFDLLSNAGDIGIQRLAYSTGSTPSGAPAAGTGYYTQANPFGSNAWAVFRFLSASAGAFDFFVQWAGPTTAFGNTPGSPGTLIGSPGANSVCGISAAHRIDGVTAWNGTTNNDGTDTKGTIVWNSGTSKMAVFPRSNAIGGPTVAQKHAVAVVTFDVQHRNHYFVDKDSVYIAHDRLADTSYSYAYFGPYTPITGTTPSSSYVMLCFAPSAGGSATAAGTAMGPVAGGGLGSSTDGGISHPRHVDVKTCTFDRYSNFFTATGQPNRSNEASIYDELPLHVAMFEATASYGICGQIYDMFREMYTVNVHDTNAAITKVVLGSSNTAASVKHILQWHSGTTPGSSTSISGTQFSIP